MTRSLLMLTLLALVGCANSNHLMVHSATPVPEPYLRTAALAEVRDQIDAAQKLDSSLVPGFYSGVSVLDFLLEESEGAAEELFDELQAEVVPQSWALPGRSVFRHEGWLVVLQTDEVHERINRWVSKWVREKEAELGVVHVELSVLSIAAREADQLCRILGVPSLPQGDASYTGKIASVEELKRLRTLRTLVAPRITTMSGQEASIQIGNSTAYIGDYEVYYVNDRKLADPVVETLLDGISVHLRPTWDPARERVAVDLDVNLAKLNGFELMKVKVGPQDLELEIPDVAHQFLESSFSNTPGETTVVTSPGLEKGEIVIVTVRTN